MLQRQQLTHSPCNPHSQLTCNKMEKHGCCEVVYQLAQVIHLRSMAWRRADRGCGINHTGRRQLTLRGMLRAFGPSAYLLTHDERQQYLADEHVWQPVDREQAGGSMFGIVRQHLLRAKPNVCPAGVIVRLHREE